MMIYIEPTPPPRASTIAHTLGAFSEDHFHAADFRPFRPFLQTYE
jgi:hypothetical protein